MTKNRNGKLSIFSLIQSIVLKCNHGMIKYHLNLCLYSSCKGTFIFPTCLSTIFIKLIKIILKNSLNCSSVKLKKTRPTSDGIDKYKMRWACLFMLGKKNMNSKTVKTWPGQVFVFFSNLKISNIDNVMFYLNLGELD